MRRSSTSRSIGRRSSFDTSVNGDGTATPDAEAANAEYEERERRRSEADQHVANYVTDQLQRISNPDAGVSYEDEFEAQLDS